MVMVINVAIGTMHLTDFMKTLNSALKRLLEKEECVICTLNRNWITATLRN